MKEILRIQSIIPKIFKKRSIKRVAAGSGDYLYLCARCSAVLCCVTGCLNPDLFYGINGNETICAAKCWLAYGYVRSSLKQPERPDTGADAVYRKIVGRRTLAVDAE